MGHHRKTDVMSYDLEDNEVGIPGIATSRLSKRSRKPVQYPKQISNPAIYSSTSVPGRSRRQITPSLDKAFEEALIAIDALPTKAPQRQKRKIKIDLTAEDDDDGATITEEPSKKRKRASGGDEEKRLKR